MRAILEDFMKRTTLFLALVVFAAIPAFAAVVPTDGTTLLVPIAGYAPGAGGELFSTDLTLVSFTRGIQRVRLTWLPLGGTASPITRTVTLDGVTFQPLIHVVRQVFGTEGVGAILIDATDPTSPVSPAIDAHSRIWTPTVFQGLTGTVSQSVPAIRLGSDWRDGSPAYIHGVRQSTGFRTNYGIVNMGPRNQDFRVLVNSATGRVAERVTVPANGIIHRPVLPGVDAELSIYIEPIPNPAVPPGGSPFSSWRAYAATTDNASGSGWTVIAIQPRTDVQF